MYLMMLGINSLLYVVFLSCFPPGVSSYLSFVISLKGCPDARPFCAAGFPLFDTIAQIVDDSMADGWSVHRRRQKRVREEDEDEDGNSSEANEEDVATEDGQEDDGDLGSVCSLLMILF
jgi:hypothetical protein